jgi:hypothetical protein
MLTRYEAIYRLGAATRKSAAAAMERGEGATSSPNMTPPACALLA